MMVDWGTMLEELTAFKGNALLMIARAPTEVGFGDKPQAHKCPFTFYGQLTPTRIPAELMLELEQEIFDPSGISTVDPPKLILKGVLISKSCGILYHIDESTGLRYGTPSRLHCSVPDQTQARGTPFATSSHVRHRPPWYNDFVLKRKL
jgi:hypothetical protein